MEHMQIVDVTLRDFSIEPKEIHVKAHELVKFVVWNRGTTVHDFRVPGVHGDVAIQNIEPERAKTLEHTFHQTGVFEILCDHPGHEGPTLRGRLVIE